MNENLKIIKSIMIYVFNRKIKKMWVYNFNMYIMIECC